MTHLRAIARKLTAFADYLSLPVGVNSRAEAALLTPEAFARQLLQLRLLTLQAQVGNVAMARTVRAIDSVNHRVDRKAGVR